MDSYWVNSRGDMTLRTHSASICEGKSKKKKLSKTRTGKSRSVYSDFPDLPLSFASFHMCHKSHVLFCHPYFIQISFVQFITLNLCLLLFCPSLCLFRNKFFILSHSLYCQRLAPMMSSLTVAATCIYKRTSVCRSVSGSNWGIEAEVHHNVHVFCKFNRLIFLYKKHTLRVPIRIWLWSWNIHLLKLA